MDGHRGPSRKDLKNSDDLDSGYTVITVDQTSQQLTTLAHAWFSVGERPSIECPSSWESLKLLGCVSDDGETFFLPCESNYNSDVTVRLLGALQEEFGEQICVVLDNASYFRSNQVREFVEGTPIELCFLPRGSPDLNPVEECWRQLNQALGNHYFGDLEALQDASLDVLDERVRELAVSVF